MLGAVLRALVAYGRFRDQNLAPTSGRLATS